MALRKINTIRDLESLLLQSEEGINLMEFLNFLNDLGVEIFESVADNTSMLSKDKEETINHELRDVDIRNYILSFHKRGE